MPFRIVRNDITKMDTEAIVNTANCKTVALSGCDYAIHMAAGYDKLLRYRKEYIGDREEGEVFITPGFDLQARYIIHAVSPRFIDGNSGEEDKLRGCYRKSLSLAQLNKIKSISFPIISTGAYAYPKEIGMRIAVDEIRAFLDENDMDITLVVFDENTSRESHKYTKELKQYVSDNYVNELAFEEYNRRRPAMFEAFASRMQAAAPMAFCKESREEACLGAGDDYPEPLLASDDMDEYDTEELESKLAERIKHRKDGFSEYLLYLIKSKGMENAEVHKRAIVDKKLFSKIKNNPDYHPTKITALCLCVGAKLNLDETKDLLGRAGYALSPSDMTDIIFSFYIEQEHYDIIDIDIMLEEYGQPCIIS